MTSAGPSDLTTALAEPNAPTRIYFLRAKVRALPATRPGQPRMQRRGRSVRRQMHAAGRPAEKHA